VARQTFDTGTSNEFPTINPSRVSKLYRYAYIACNPADCVGGLQQQVARIDLQSGTVARHDFAPKGYVGQPVCIATADGAQDEGGVVTLICDTERQSTDIVGVDARNIPGQPLFVARLKHHVPYSLHGTFTPRLF